jgi:hypothetical protein
VCAKADTLPWSMSFSMLKCVVLFERSASLLDIGRALRDRRSGPFGAADGRLVDMGFSVVRVSR